MKIFLPFRIQATGGTSIFAKKFKHGLEQQGHEVFTEFPPEYDILFVIVQCNPLYLIHAKLHGKKIIQRLDGVYYWSVAHWKYPLLNVPPFIVHKFFADFTVYQSEYSKYCADIFLGSRKDKQSIIIPNGIDLSTFTPTGKTLPHLRDNPEQHLFITVSKFRRRDQILPLIEAMGQYRSLYESNAKLLIIGDFNGEVAHIPGEFSAFTYLVFLDKIRNEDLPRYERSSDVFLMTHLNPPCPNNIIEAMGCGLPICGIADGAMAEITAPGKNSLLLPAIGNAFWSRRIYDARKFADNLHTLMQHRSTYAAHSRQRALDNFSLKTMVARYIKIFS